MADEKLKCNVRECPHYGKDANRCVILCFYENPEKCEMYQAWNIRVKEVKRLCRRIFVEAEYVITAKEELDNMTSGNYIHKVGSTQWKLTCISKKLKSHIKRYKEKTEGKDE